MWPAETQQHINNAGNNHLITARDEQHTQHMVFNNSLQFECFCYSMLRQQEQYEVMEKNIYFSHCLLFSVSSCLVTINYFLFADNIVPELIVINYIFVILRLFLCD